VRENAEEAELPGTTVRIHEGTHETLRDLKRQTGETMPDLVARAVDQFYRSLLIAETNCGYAALREDATAWAEEQAELATLEGSLADGLD
jgi:hypothetical protein